MVKNVEEKDIYTHNHGDRVRDYSIKIAKVLNLSNEKIENTAFASLLVMMSVKFLYRMKY